MTNRIVMIYFYLQLTYNQILKTKEGGYISGIGQEYLRKSSQAGDLK